MKSEPSASTALSRDRCFELLASVPIGRVVHTDRALPAVLPMNFVVDGRGVTLFTGSDAVLAAAARDAVVAFQADDFDPVTMAGWSVTITGRAAVLDPAGDAEHLAELRVRSWARRRDGRFVRILGQRVTGQRFGPAAVGGVAETTVA